MLRMTLCCLLILVGLSAAADVEVKGHKYPETIEVDDKTLYLNGAGLRSVKYFGMNVNVYVAGLYLENNFKTADEIRKDTGLKHIRSIYLRAVGASKQRGPWKDGIRENCYANCDESKKVINTWNSKLVKTKTGGRFDITFYADKVKMNIDGSSQVSETIESAPFAKDLLNVWLGSKPASSDLKKSFLRGRSPDLKVEAKTETDESAEAEKSAEPTKEEPAKK